jgi:hypothetical protein
MTNPQVTPSPANCGCPATYHFPGCQLREDDTDFDDAAAHANLLADPTSTTPLPEMHP